MSTFCFITMSQSPLQQWRPSRAKPENVLLVREVLFLCFSICAVNKIRRKKKKKPGFFHKSCFSRAALCFRRLENWNFIWVLPLYNSFTYFHSCFLTPPGLGTHRWGENASRIRLFPKPQRTENKTNSNVSNSLNPKSSDTKQATCP